MTILTRSLVAGICLLVLGALFISVYLSRPLFKDTLDPAMATGVAIAPVDRALTLARYREQGRPGRILLVLSYAAESIGGVDLTTLFDRPDVRNYDGVVPLLDAAGTIPAGTVIFSGTPAGVLFKPHNLWNPWVYLRPVDEVVIRADGLGVIRNQIVN